MSIASIGALSSGLLSPAQTGQNLPVGSSNASASGGFTADLAAATAAHSMSNMPSAKLSTYFTETPAQRMQDDWLSQHGMTADQYNSLDSTDKAKITSEMKEDIETKMREKMGTSSAASGSGAAASSAMLAGASATSLLA